MTVGQKIIHNQSVSLSEANNIFRDLKELDKVGVWGGPDDKTGEWQPPAWAVELSVHYKMGAAHIMIQGLGWRAVARFYKDAFDRKA